MLVATVITLAFIADLIRMTQKKRRKLAHPHVCWDKGTIFAAYLYSVFFAHLCEGIIITVFYLVDKEGISIYLVIFRVVAQIFFMISKFLLWWYHRAHKDHEKLDIFGIKI